MKQFMSHIDFLIQKPDCVIIPDFGGFVLSHKTAHISEDGTILPPRVDVGFNPDLKYNDGLLAESYMNVYSISYDVACKRIADAVQKLNTILFLKQPVRIGNLGKLTLDIDGLLCFMPNENLSSFYAENYGLSILTISRLKDIPVTDKNILKVKNRHNSYQRIFAGIGAVAAAVLVFFVASTPISDGDIKNNQKAGFFTDMKMSVDLGKDTKLDTIVQNQVLPELSSSSVVKGESDKINLRKKIDVKEIKKTSSPIYYVIVGSTSAKFEAQNILKRIKNQGYNEANIVTSSDRSRIYVASFGNKNQAEKYLSNLKNKNPKFNDAWIYTKRK